MKLEELIAALNQSNIEMNAQEEIIKKLEQREKLQKAVTKHLKELRKTEELEKSKRIGARADAYDNGYANGLRDGRVQDSEYFSVLETSKEDMKEELEASPKTLLEIDQFTDAEMEEIATDIGSQLEEYYWDALRLAVEAELERER